MSYNTITHSVVLHAYLRRAQILFTFVKHQVMYSVFSIVPCVEVSCKGLFLMQQHSKEQVQALVFNHSQHCLDLCFILECIIIFVPFAWISQLYCCSINSELSPWYMVNLKENFLLRSEWHAFLISAKNRYIFAKFIIELVPVKRS